MEINESIVFIQDQIFDFRGLYRNNVLCIKKILYWTTRSSPELTKNYFIAEYKIEFVNHTWIIKKKKYILEMINCVFYKSYVLYQRENI